MDATANLLAALVRINSINPSLVPGAPGEGEIAGFVRAWLAERGIEAEIYEASAANRPSVIGCIRGTGGGRSLLLNAHMDTVGVAGMAAPFDPRESDGRMYGRGSCDMKGSLAACMLALDLVRAARPRGDVILAAVSDEEHASLGMQCVLHRIRPDAAIVTEPTSLQVCIAHKGFSWHEITTMGRAAHGSRPDLGVDAIMHMGRVLHRLENLQAELARRTPHPLLGPPSLHASLIRGGQELATYPASCTLQLERRTLPSETPSAVEGELDAILTDLGVEDQQFRARQKTTLVRPPFGIDQDAAIVQTLRDQATLVMGHCPATIGQTFWMDAALIARAGIPTVVFGPHGVGMHAAEEWVELRSVDLLRDVLVRTTLAFCG
jgi:acetylornithine deacetylase